MNDAPGSKDDDVQDALALARLGLSAGLRTAGWAAGQYVSASRRLLGVMVRPDTAVDLVHDVRRSVRTAARDLVGYTDLEDRLRNAAADSPMAQKVSDGAQWAASAVPAPKSREQRAADKNKRSDTGSHPTLRESGDQLLRKSRDVWYEDEPHPAYERILEALAPDEGRILRLMQLKGPQPSIDVRTGGPIGLINSELIAPGLNMIGARAGTKYVDRVPSYLNNLQRLGLVWFSRETLHDHLAYQVVEAQPEVLEAMHSVRAAKIIRRSIHLTPFGEDFCRECLAPANEDGTSLPEHRAPEESAAAPGE